MFFLVGDRQTKKNSEISKTIVDVLQTPNVHFLQSANKSQISVEK
jgi:hypothetical protein